MKISVVTISFNQAHFLERTIRSVISQHGVDFEYIIADPGSTDGSREIIKHYRAYFKHIIFKKDDGPADGLNKAFEKATGDIYFYLNSDDTVEPDAFTTALHEFERDPDLEVLCGHAWAVDENDVRLRRIWSDPWSPGAQAFGAAIQMQPSTYIRAESYKKVGGFNPENRSNWDGELMLNLFLAGAKTKIINQFMSNYRLHATSITGSGKEASLHAAWQQRQFRMIKGRDMRTTDRVLRCFWLVYRQISNPSAFFERLFHGPIFRRKINAG